MFRMQVKHWVLLLKTECCLMDMWGIMMILSPLLNLIIAYVNFHPPTPAAVAIATGGV